MAAVTCARPGTAWRPEELVCYLFAHPLKVNLAKSSVHLAPLGHRLFGYPILVQAPSIAARFDHANPGAAAAVSMARSPRPRLHTRRCLGLALPADSSTAALGRHRPACAMRCDPATPRPNQLRGFPARLSWPPTMPAPTRLHPNPLVCPDRSNSHPSIDVSPHPRCHLCLPTRSCTCLAMPIHHAAHSLHVIARDKRLILTTSASPYTPSRISS